ncbi:MAG: phosphoribosylglycinamide formyltransferase [Defluviitaleaceae bacterium]|nr:phosphoribosylglycinamide formyltransferase [Defluviitaleaceae bacterium]
MNIAVLASHGGSNLQAIIDGCKSGKIGGRVCVVISNNGGSMALKRAANEGIPAFHISKATAPDFEELLLKTLQTHGSDIVFLAGYLKKVPTNVLEAYKGKIYNIHPSLLPKYGGKGMFGINVHAAVLAAGETETGVTIHRVTAEYDEGDILAQKKVRVLADDTPEALAARVLEQEHGLLAEFLAEL